MIMTTFEEYKKRIIEHKKKNREHRAPCGKCEVYSPCKKWRVCKDYHEWLKGFVIR